MNDLIFQKANSSDLPFLIAAIKSAGKLGTAGCIYERIFHLSAAEVDTLFFQALSIEGGGHQLALSTFFVFKQGDVPVACCSSWVEAEDGMPSGFKLAAVLCDLLGFEKWLNAKVAFKAFADATPRRNAGALQMETFYVKPSSRGQGLTTRIIQSVISHFGSVVTPGAIAEITMLDGNSEALRAYQKAGFQILRKGVPGNALFRALTGSTGFIQLHKTIGA